MPRLSVTQTAALVAVAKTGSIRDARWAKASTRTIGALKRKGLMRFDDDRLKFVLTDAGRTALVEHGYEQNGNWRGSNQPRKYQ